MFCICAAVTTSSLTIPAAVQLVKLRLELLGIVDPNDLDTEDIQSPIIAIDDFPSHDTV